MRTITLLTLVLIAAPFAALPAAATCTVVTSDLHADVNYTTLCVLDQGSFTDSTQTFGHDHVAHASHAVEADPAFEYAYVRLDQGTWEYDDGDVQHAREFTHVGAGTFMGARGLVGTGAHANLHQRDQSAPEDGDGACSGIVGESTCLGAGSWFAVQGVASIGAGLYYQQNGEGEACEERYELDLSLGLVFVPIILGPGSCTAEAPMLYDEVRFRDLPMLP